MKSHAVRSYLRWALLAALLGLLLLGAAWSVRHQLQLSIIWPLQIWRNQQLLARDVDTWRASEVATAPRPPAAGPLQVSAENPRYFVDPAGNPVFLSGAHTWSTLQDNGHSSTPPAFDYDQYLDFLAMHNHNLVRLWTWEQARWSVETRDRDYWYTPMPYARPGPELALDGAPRFDLGQWNEAYFERMRERVAAAQARGYYVVVMLFDGWSNSSRKGSFALGNPWHGHPYNVANNINGIDGDPNRDDSGEETHTIGDPALLAYQEAYVRKVIDTLNDFDNVLYEISNESHRESIAWQEHMVQLIHTYEATKPKQHPVGMTSVFPDGDNRDLLASSADWIAPNGDPAQPFLADGSKVIVADSDHICPFCVAGDWVWRSFTRGHNLALMDGYDGAAYGSGGAGFDYQQPATVAARRNMGDARALAQHLDLLAMRPDDQLCSTGYCLVKPQGPGAAFVVYAPNAGAFTVDLTGVSESLQPEWFNPDTGAWQSAAQVAGGAMQNFEAPWAGSAVLYLHTGDPAFVPEP